APLSMLSEDLLLQLPLHSAEPHKVRLSRRDGPAASRETKRADRAWFMGWTGREQHSVSSPRASKLCLVSQEGPVSLIDVEGRSQAQPLQQSSRRRSQASGSLQQGHQYEGNITAWLHLDCFDRTNPYQVISKQ
ncbi:hypothetical protein KUCAC02_031390, partial [Chaenocephalus aceratus]